MQGVMGMKGTKYFILRVFSGILFYTMNGCKDESVNLPGEFKI
jgi:hypothetical protein